MILSTFCIKRPVFATVLSLVIIVVGLIGLWRIPVRGYPNIDAPVISVTTTYTGASPSIVESQLTTPIENQLMGLSGLESMNSTSEMGRSRVVLDFTLGTDVYHALNDVRNALGKITKQLPDGVDAPVIERRDPNEVQTVVLALTDPSLSTMALTDYINRHLLATLQQISGVASVEAYNDQDYAMRILLNPAKMAANQVTVSDLSQALTQQNVNVPSGQLDNNQQQFNVLTQGQLSNVQSFRHLIIRQQNGAYLRFDDVAKVNVGGEQKQSTMRVNGHPAVGIGIYADQTANPIQVANAIKKQVDQLSRQLPTGMTLHVVWDRTTYLHATLMQATHDLMIAVVMVAFIVLLFLGCWRSSLIPVVTIPICIIGVFALMAALGYSINLFTLLALVLAIGLVVDDAIVVLENIYRYIEQGLSPMKAAMQGSRQIGFAVIAMTITLAAVYAPIGFATGMTGIIFREFAFTLALAVILSGFVALTLSPMLCGRLLRPVTTTPTSSRQSFSQRYQFVLAQGFTRLSERYQQSLYWVLRHRVKVIGGLLVVVALGAWCFHRLPSSLSPHEDQGVMMLSIDQPPNASLAYMDQQTQRISDYLQHLPGVKTVLMMANNRSGAFGYAVLKPWDQRHVTVAQLMKQASAHLRQWPGLRIRLFSPSELGGGGRYGNAIRMAVATQQSFPELEKTVGQFLKDVAKLPGVMQPQQTLSLDTQQYVVHIKRNEAAALQVNVQAIMNTLQTMIGGATVTHFDWQDQEYDVLLQVPDKQRDNLTVMNTLYVRNANNTMIPLSSLVSIKRELIPQSLPHDNRLRADTVLLQVAPGYSLGNVLDELRHAAQADLPSGYTYHFRGAAQRFIESHSTMLGAFVLALVFIYLVLAAQFESFTDPFIILLSVPLSIVGAVITLMLTGHELSIYTNIGFVTLIGLIAKHGILITEFANQKRKDGVVWKDALVSAAKQRLRPILMTTAAMVIGALPLVLAHGAGALSRQEIGWVIVGGMTIGTFFSLYVVPIAYSFFKKGQIKSNAALPAISHESS